VLVTRNLPPSLSVYFRVSASPYRRRFSLRSICVVFRTFGVFHLFRRRFCRRLVVSHHSRLSSIASCRYAASDARLTTQDIVFVLLPPISSLHHFPSSQPGPPSARIPQTPFPSNRRGGISSAMFPSVIASYGRPLKPTGALQPPTTSLRPRSYSSTQVHQQTIGIVSQTSQPSSTSTQDLGLHP
jgi:hypothetical protein